ncbi:DUF6185 family protein [Streptomyces sp. NPDC089424]|uniref:DUF6185 family protein n=1 Tax=Streptomyces sp. NPDC089424 TaxID=3365917 RepID=UPI0038237FEF
MTLADCRGFALSLLIAMLVGLMTLGATGASASPTDSHGPVDSCWSQELKTAVAEASLRLEHDNRTYTKVISELTVRIPMSWELADGILLSPDSDRYRRAMRCLARGSFDGMETNWTEWRSGEPVVTPLQEPPATTDGSARHVEVRMRAYGWIDQRGEARMGPWTVHVGKATWLVRLTPPDSLQGASWRRVSVDPGQPGAVSAKPEATVGRDGRRLTWFLHRSAPTAEVRIAPAWPRAIAAQGDSPPFSTINEAGILLWSLALVVALWHTLQRMPRTYAPHSAEERTRNNLRNWSWVLLGVVTVVQGRNLYLGATGAFQDDEQWAQQASHAPWAWLTAAVAGSLMLLFARPSSWRILVTGALLNVVALVPALWPGVVGLRPQEFVRPPNPSDGTLAVVICATVCSLALLVIGSVAALRRLAVDGGLWSPRRTESKLAPLLTGTLTVIAILIVCYGAAAERDWDRASWLSPHIDPGRWVPGSGSAAFEWAFGYGSWHRAELRSNLLWFTHNTQNWWCAMLWIPSGLAILAVLRARVERNVDVALANRGPAGVDRRLLILLFPVMVALNIGEYSANSALTWVWFFVYVFALAGTLRLVSGRAVGDHLLPLSCEPLNKTLCVADRPGLLDRSRTYRELQARMVRLDRGQADDGNGRRRDLENRSSGLHRWRSSTGDRDRLPGDISVVDAAMALGPGRTWWENGVTAARLTQPVALPLTAGLVWAHQLRGESLTSTLHDRLGLPDVLLQFILWQIGYAAAGLVLGALWHQLPGRRGPTKAFVLTLAYSFPAGLFAFGNWVLGEEQAGLAIAMVAMLLILTLTSILMDLETFRSERLYWRSRFELLISVYRMRFFSIQLAWILAQAAAVVTIWQFFAEPGGSPPTVSGR